MPVYQYQDVHYDLPDGLSNEQALSKIKTHLGETEDNFATKAFKEAGSATTLGNAIPGALEAIAGGVGSMANMAVSGIAGPVKSMFTGKSAADEIGNVSHAIEQAIPYMPETESGKAYLNLLSIPVEGIHKLGEKAFEATGSPLVGAGVETIGNAAMLALPALKRGKKPTQQSADFDAKLKGALDDTSSVDYGTPIDRNVDPIGWEKRQLEIRNKLDKQEMLSTSNEVNQYPLVDQPLEGRIRSKNEAVLGDWRVDENGIPIKADLSMDVQNAQQPLQRNLWGDELPQKHPQENTMSLPEAIDSMPNLPWRTERDAGIDLLNKGGMGPEGRLDAAILEATPEFKVPRGQRGGIDFEILPKAFRDFVEKWHTAGGNFSHTGVSRMLDDHPVKLTKDQRSLLESLYPETAKTYQEKIDRAWAKSDPEKAARWGKRYDDALIAEAVTNHYDAFGKGFKLDGPRYDSKTGPYAGRVAAQEQASAAIDVAKRVVPRNQRGAIDLGPSNNLKQRQEKIEKIVGEKIFAKPPTAEEVLTQAIPEGRDGRGINSMEAGATLTGAKRNSALITGVSRIVQHAKNIAEDAIRTSVFPTEKGLRTLKSEEIVQLHKIMQAEMFNRRQLSMTALADLGLSEKQLLAYQAIRDMNKKALERQNAVRIASGKKPVTELEAFMTSRWKGDFRRAIHDKDGKLVWYLAAESKRGLTQQTDALMSKFPELKGGSHSDHTVSSVRGTNLNAKEMYTEMLDILGRDDPAIAKIEEWMQEQVANEARGMLAQEKHFKNKSNVRGFIGDRPSNTFFGKFDPRKEALDFFQEQITYSKNAHKWSGMQEAGQELKKIFSNEELAAQQPNNMAYARDYYRNQIGLSTARAVADLENAIRQTGVSPHLLNAGVGNVKNLWITQKLAASAGFISSNIIQAANILPHLSDIMMKHGGNPLSAVTLGIPSGMLMASGHMLVAKGDRGLYKYLGVMPEAQGQFLAKAMKYAEDNSVTARSIYDETPIASSFSKTAKISEIAGKTITTPETVLRSVAYMTYVNMLKSSGKFKNDLEIFRLAEEKVNISMADYRQGEKAMLFDKLGIAGNMMNTLQTFPINFYQQWNWAAREVGRGNPLPAATMFAVQAYMAGAMGIPGFADTDKLWNFMKETAADHSPLLWNKMKGVDLKQIMLNVGDKALYGGLSEQTGISFTSRAAAPAGSEMLASPAGPYIDLARQAGDVASAGISPGGQSAAQAMLSVAPTGLQGALEVGPLKDQTSVVNPETGQRVYGSPRDLAKREGQVSRTPEEENIRAWGLRSQREVQEKDESYRINKLDRDSKTVVAALPGRVYNELRNNNTEKAKALIKLYTSLTGKEITSEQIENEALKEYTTSMQRTKMNVTTLPGMLAIKRLQQIQEQK